VNDIPEVYLEIFSAKPDIDHDLVASAIDGLWIVEEDAGRLITQPDLHLMAQVWQVCSLLLLHAVMADRYKDESRRWLSWSQVRSILSKDDSVRNSLHVLRKKGAISHYGNKYGIRQSDMNHAAQLLIKNRPSGE
jgi:hypothetical protein